MKRLKYKTSEDIEKHMCKGSKFIIFTNYMVYILLATSILSIIFSAYGYQYTNHTSTDYLIWCVIYVMLATIFIIENNSIKRSIEYWSLVQKIEFGSKKK